MAEQQENICYTSGTLKLILRHAQMLDDCIALQARISEFESRHQQLMREITVILNQHTQSQPAPDYYECSPDAIVAHSRQMIDRFTELNTKMVNNQELQRQIVAELNMARETLQVLLPAITVAELQIHAQIWSTISASVSSTIPEYAGVIADIVARMARG